MSISERDDILNALVDDAREYMTAGAASKYQIGLYEVLRGIHDWEDCPNKPCLSLFAYRDEKTPDDETFGGRYMRTLFIMINGYTETDGYTHDSIHKLARDTEYFLENDFTYKDQVFLGEMVIYEGGISDPVGIFRLDVAIKYFTDITSP